MSILDWFKSKFTHRAKSLARYRSGMAKAQKGDFAGAVEDYTAAIEASSVPDDVLGMALYNRALAYSSLRQPDKAADDLAKVLKMPDLPENIKLAASQRRERIRRREA